MLLVEDWRSQKVRLLLGMRSEIECGVSLIHSGKSKVILAEAEVLDTSSGCEESAVASLSIKAELWGSLWDGRGVRSY